MKHVHLVGLGAVGAAYGAALAAAGVEVRVLAGAERIRRYREQPTRVNGVEQHFELTERTQRPADLVILAVKEPHLAEALEVAAPSVRKGTVVISLLNGIDSETLIAERLPQAVVLLALSVGIDAVRDGRAVTYTSLGRILFGGATNPGPQHVAVAQVAALFEAAGIPHAVPADMVHELWWKFLVNVGVNQVSAVLKAPYREFQAEGSPARAVMLAAQQEVVAVAATRGVTLTEADLARWLDVLAGLGPDNFTSMAQDTLAGRATEVDTFAGRVIELGRAAGVPTPVNDTLFGLLKAMEAR